MSQIPNIPIVYEEFPDDYINDVMGWGFDESTIKDNSGKLLTLDIDFGNKCSLNCPFCFRKNNSVDTNDRGLRSDDLIRVVMEAKQLGLRSVKLLGAGEPLENPGILDFLHVLKNLGIVPIIFSKTGILGDDKAVARLFGIYEIRSAHHLIEELKQCGASVVVGFNSFNHRIQSQMAGNGPDFLQKRNRSVDLLVEAGFNQSNPTRLALGIHPITTQNYKEAFRIYKWARLRNIYAIVTPTMVSGLMKGDKWKSITPNADELIDLYTKIYRFNIETKLMSFEQVAHEGISAYAGGLPCNQVAAGLYVTLNGVVLSCPGCEDNVEID